MSQPWWPSPSSQTAFISPTAVVGGAGAARNMAGILTEHLGISAGSILLAVDDAVLNAGLIQPISDQMTSSGYEVHVRSGFGAEPSSSIIDTIANQSRADQVSCVVGIGGGSVLDSSKLIALLLRNDGGSADWTGAVTPENGIAPLVLVPTTCGTGSEATRIAMVTVEGNKRASSCAQYVPRVAVIDPELAGSLPKSVIAATGMDALAHAVESLMASSASVMSAHHALRAIELLVRNLEEAYLGDREALANTLWASHIAGQSLNAGVVLGHSLAYCLAHAQPMPHGVSCAMALPYCIAYNQNLDPALATRLSLTLTDGRSGDLRLAAEEVEALSGRMGLPRTLAEVRISPDSIPDMARLCIGDYPRPTNPEPFVEELLEELFRAMETGDLDRAFAVTAR
ncbi:iron-containing alcohol dehydrogenase family protein [Arthrobacter subterraneus]|uniref:iron-containing alcohol dehydrogenase family protein n=1 Tax=Arthrobacter subterraneus TaxID=335973 RepID=UPI00382F4B4F